MASDVFNLNRAHLTIRHITFVKKIWWRHQQTISTKSRKEEVKSILDANKESKTNDTSEAVEACESQRISEW